MRQMLLSMAMLLVALVLGPAAVAQVVISEARIDQAGVGVDDDPQEYYELRGSPGTSLAGLSYVVLGSRPINLTSGIPYGGAGVIVHVNSFPAGAVIPPSGAYLVRKPSMVLPPGVTAQLTIPLGFEDDSTQTHLLVRNFDDALFEPPSFFSPIGFDLDLENDGVLDIAPWEEVLDSVSFLSVVPPTPAQEGDDIYQYNRAYALAQLGPTTTGGNPIPPHIFRCGNAPNWRVGGRIYAVYAPTTASVNGPTQLGFSFAQPYDQIVGAGIGEAGAAVRLSVSFRATMTSPLTQLDVSIAPGGTIAFVPIGTILGTLGTPACQPQTRILTIPLNVFNQLICDSVGATPTLRVRVVPSGTVTPCSPSQCSVQFIYERPQSEPRDSPGRANPSCGCVCQYPAGVLDAVFLVDTSESMDDEAASICARIPEVTAALEAQGYFVRATVLGITESPGGDYGCLTGSVSALLGATVPNANGAPIGVLDHAESWGDAAAVVAERFDWQSGAARMIVSMSDAAPHRGSGPRGREIDAADTASIDNAIAVASSKGVMVSALVGTGAAPGVEALATRLAAGTGGVSGPVKIAADELAARATMLLVGPPSGAGCSSCEGDLNLDGEVNPIDLDLYNCLTNFACRDVDNDGTPGTPLDLAIVEDFHVCTAADFCGQTQLSCLTPHMMPGCDHSGCCIFTCLIIPDCCSVAWDAVCADFAISNCGSCGALSTTQSCFTVNDAPGCNDSACCAIVCGTLPECCSLLWDAACAALARTECLECGGTSTIDCFLPSPTPFCANEECCAAVCEFDLSCCLSSWDSTCVALARKLCAECGDPALQPCDEQSFAPGCLDESCCETVCEVDPSCCLTMWDESCVQFASQFCLTCGSQLAGSCCVRHGNPFCDNADCCAQVCSWDPFCCAASWDEICVTLAGILCPSLVCPCGSPASTPDCTVAHVRPGCQNELCCQLVCEWDPFCCLVRWDDLCANFADAQCALPDNGPYAGICVPGTGSCTTTHFTPGCDTPPSCCAFVCNLDPTCCTDQWDQECVNIALNVCLNCGDPDSGSCYAPSGSPGCSDPDCCTQVCNVDPFCCVFGWDGTCVSIAVALCGDPIEACENDYPLKRSCFMASPGRGCREGSCCSLICGDGKTAGIDVYCCTVAWDAICAQEAALFCTVPSTAFGLGDCFTAHCCGAGPDCTTPCHGCTDPGCAAAVCTYLSHCCTVQWDAACASTAWAVCVDKEPCPGPGRCDQQHRNTGCNDATCCNGVCAFDPHCCQVQWDQTCVDAQRVYCLPQPQWDCPCDGSCFVGKSSPGCNDRSCCSAVCNVQAACCEVEWDTVCASIARTICCGSGLCGDPCHVGCLVPHPTPYCNDSYCCEAVCSIDPFCCALAWDTLCAQFAAFRCQGTCGQPSSGNCFAAHDTAGCRLGACCKTVCLVDPACCEEEWDSSCADIALALPACLNERPRCGTSGSGSCCVAHLGPACEDEACCDAVCKQDLSCCEEEWDELCSSLADRTKQCAERCDPECGAACAGSCCLPHPNPRCSSLECCEAVCFGWTDKFGQSYPGDAFCCNVEWDTNCASRAIEYAQIPDPRNPGQVIPGPCSEPCPQPSCGVPLAGDCCEPHGNPFCADDVCCQAVCELDSFCCEVSWDGACTGLAFELATKKGLEVCNCVIPAECGLGGDCFFPHATPFCNDAPCCELVCVDLPLCCEVSWDFDCASLAFKLCFFIPDPPVNDECIDPFTMFEGLNGFSTIGATQSMPPPVNACDGATFAADTWYVFTAPTAGTWELSTCNLTNFDTMIAVYVDPTIVVGQDPICDNLVLAPAPAGWTSCANNTPFCSQLTSTVRWTAEAGMIYVIRVGSPLPPPESGQIPTTGSGITQIQFIEP